MPGLLVPVTHWVTLPLSVIRTAFIWADCSSLEEESSSASGAGSSFGPERFLLRTRLVLAGVAEVTGRPLLSCVR
jgi:hypothetical protein